MIQDITGVVGAQNVQPEILLGFYKEFRTTFPDIPLVFSCLQADQDLVEALRFCTPGDNNLTIIAGNPKDKHKVSFSEVYDAGINAVKTEKLVLLHTDQILEPHFFEELEKTVQPGTFDVYVTVEPERWIGFPRPGKIIRPFGDDFDIADREGLEALYETVRKTKPQTTELRGCTFFIAGYLKDFQDVGGFDYQTFELFCEDNDFAVRAKLAGKLCKLNNYALTYHFGSKTSNRFREASDVEVESNRKFVKKWGFECWWADQNIEKIRPHGINRWKWKLEGNETLCKDEGLKLFIPESSDKLFDIVVHLDSTGCNLRQLYLYLEDLAVVGELNLSHDRAICSGPGFTLDLRKHTCSDKREDKNNYLLLQKNIEYEYE